MLAAVLLRREVVALAGLEKMSGLPKPTAVALMGEIAQSLMNLIFQEGDYSTRRQVGHCLAELCYSLSLLDMGSGKELMKEIFSQLESGVSQYFSQTSLHNEKKPETHCMCY